ncbi:unnamed protein product, partial [Brenthis ino]
MNYLIYILLYSVVLASSRIHAANLFAGEEVDLGPYNIKAAVGKKVPDNLQKAEVDVQVSTNARTLVEHLRSKFSSGAPPLPPLDPYKSKGFSAVSLDGNNNLLLTGKINIKEVILTGGKDFRLGRIELSTSNNNIKVNLELTIPELNGNVLFDAQLRLAGIFPVDVQGEIRASLKGVKIDGAAWAEEKKAAKHIYNLQGLRADFHADDIKIRLVKSNLSEFIIITAGSYIPIGPNTGLRSTIQNLVKNYVADEVFKHLNSILSTLTIGEIKSLLKVN